MDWNVVAGVVAALTLIATIAIAVARRHPKKPERRVSNFERARRAFHQQRERLEAKFVELAASSGKPRGLRWLDCDFQDEVAYARDRRTGSISAFVAVNIAFEAIEGGGMEHVEAVGNIRAATAVFMLVNDRWDTQGRSLFNLLPAEAIERFHEEFELVAQDDAHNG